MEPLVRIDLVAAVIFIGIFLGFFLSFFFLKKSWRSSSANLFMGLLILTFSLNMLEGWLNYTGYIFQVLHLTNFSEPTNFIIAPLLYLFVSRQLGEKKSSRQWMHFIPFIFWTGYMFFFFRQSADFKYNANIFALHFDLTPLALNYSQLPTDNPLGIRNYVNELTILHILIYCIFIFGKLRSKARTLGETLVNSTNETLKSIRNSCYHFLVLFLLLVVIKIYFKDDVGDYIMYLYLTFLLVATGFQVVNTSSYFDRPSNFLEFPSLKYQKSSLTESDKQSILEKIKGQMEQNHYYKSNLASLSELSKLIQESSHHVSQVINEQLEHSFFELLASYRIQEAQRILSSEKGKKLTIEEVAEQVGYNSKSAFNAAFKKITESTPSAYRKSH